VDQIEVSKVQFVDSRDWPAWERKNPRGREGGTNETRFGEEEVRGHMESKLGAEVPAMRAHGVTRPKHLGAMTDGAETCNLGAITYGADPWV
jgi:hypothetical protein